MLSKVAMFSLELVYGYLCIYVDLLFTGKKNEFIMLITYI